MAIPLKYNIRNLMVRKVTTLLTVLGIALVVAVFLSVMSLAEGLANVFKSSGSEKNILVLRKNSQSEVQSGITRNQVPLVMTLAGIDEDEDENAIASAEIVVILSLDKIGGGLSNVTLRGVSEKAPLLRPNFKLVAGRMFRPGVSEVIVSRRLSERFNNCRLGDTIRFGVFQWHIVGLFDANGTAPDSEIWTDAEGVMNKFKRPNYSSILLQVTDRGTRDQVSHALANDTRLSLEGKSERLYYDEQTSAASPIKFLGYFVGVIMIIGAGFGAMNTMYATISARTKEIATLRVLGFSRASILTSFVIESLCLSVIGGLLGCVFGIIAVKLALSGVTGTTNFATFTEVVFAFKLTPGLLLTGMIFSIVTGFFGGIFPASQAAMAKISTTLRQM